MNMSTLPSPQERNDEAQYKSIEQWCKREIGAGSDFLFDPVLFQRTLEEKSQEWDFAYESLHSFIRNLHVHHVKINAPLVQRNMRKHAEEYAKKGRSMVSLAKQANYPPYLFSRYLVEQIADLPNGKKGLTQAMREPAFILGKVSVVRAEFLESELSWVENSAYSSSTTRLSWEVERAIATDPMYGPSHDQRRHMVGIEYEVLLEEKLKGMDIPFDTEADLRLKGSSRTPDVLLQIPIGVQVGSEWHVVCWIDSKAMYGDAGTHKTSVVPQAESYVHRFGPGMILYFFGHAPLSKLGDANGDIVIQGWDLPKEFMWPTGDIGRRPDPANLLSKHPS